MSTSLQNTVPTRIHAAAGRATRLILSAALATALVGTCQLVITPNALADDQITVTAEASTSLSQTLAAAESSAVAQVVETTQNDPLTTVMTTALSLQGTPYRAGGASPATGFDCSGFTMYCYAQAGINLTHNAAAQYNEGTKVETADLQPGDLVFFGGSSISHVGIYVGDGQYIHSKQTGSDVRIETLADRDNYVGAVRVI